MTSPPPSNMPPFPVRRFARSYDREQVDEFFTTIPTRSKDEIQRVTFAVRWRNGYDQETVDVALDAWAEAATS